MRPPGFPDVYKGSSTPVRRFSSSSLCNMTLVVGLPNAAGMRQGGYRFRFIPTPGRDVVAGSLSFVKKLHTGRQNDCANRLLPVGSVLRVQAHHRVCAAEYPDFPPASCCILSMSPIPEESIKSSRLCGSSSWSSCFHWVYSGSSHCLATHSLAAQGSETVPFACCCFALASSCA
jgi:hypothetical protein